MIHAMLTIDDIASANTPAIVDYLNEKGITALMFAVGENVERYYDNAIYALRHGMIVGNHSYDTYQYFFSKHFIHGAYARRSLHRDSRVHYRITC